MKEDLKNILAALVLVLIACSTVSIIILLNIIMWRGIL